MNALKCLFCHSFWCWQPRVAELQRTYQLFSHLNPTCQQGACPCPHPVRLPVAPQYLVGFQAFSLKLSRSTSSHHRSKSRSPKPIELRFWHVKIITQAEISLSPVASPPAWTTLSDKSYICSKTKMMQMCFKLCKREHSCKSCTKILTSTLIFR